MELKRRPLQGVLNILSFNRHFYVAGIAALAILVALHVFLPWSNFFYSVVLAAFVYGLLMPLVVSAYVYDFSGYYHLKWLQPFPIHDSADTVLLNINAGFDETSFLLKEHFPKSQLQAFDFYNAKQHTEAAIIRARKVSSVYPNTQQIKTSLIPIKDQSVDVVFLLSAAHEIRSFDEKVLFLKECHRVCKPNGRVIVVEHLRDLPNFFAFTIGFTHFFSKDTWQKAFHQGGFKTFEETKFTAFMSVFQTKPL